MELVNDFTVKVPLTEAWHTLTDLELIAPCLPGAQLEEVEGETYRGVVKIKVGPISAAFQGEAHFLERDDVGHKAVLKAKGRDKGGKGNAEATITAELVAIDGTSTKVTVTTDLTITGKVAQFGRGALADVSSKLLGQFVENLENEVLTHKREATVHHLADVEAAAPTFSAAEPTVAAANADAAPLTPATDTAPAAAEPAAAPAAAPTGPRKIEQRDVKPIDLLETAGAPMAKRLIPLGVLITVLFFLIRRRRKG